MTLQELVKKICEIEGKKIQVSVGNVREIVSIISDLYYADDTIARMLYQNGKRRKRVGAGNK